MEAETTATKAETTVTRKAAKRTDGRIARGNQTRQMILRHAVDVASVYGLDGLSLGHLAEDLELSKSGVFSLFGSKRELQLATVRTAVAVFLHHVVIPARRSSGITKIRHLCEKWLNYSQTRVFTGGCFFYAVTAEFGARSGPVHDEIVAAQANWRMFIQQLIEEAREAGEVREDTDVRRLAFELIAFLEAANCASLLSEEGGGDRDDSVYDIARASILSRLRAAATDPQLLPDTP